jgi:DNA processing protein
MISGIARSVVVIEAGAKFGSLITTPMALEQGRDVLPFPVRRVIPDHRAATD